MIYLNRKPVKAAIVPDYFGQQVRHQPDRLAVHELATGQSWTYRRFDEAISAYAGALCELGITPGARVAALAKNRAALVMLHLACARLGAMYVPLNWRLSAPELGVVIADAQPAMVLGDDMLAEAGLSGMSLDEFAALAQTATPLAQQGPPDNVPSLLLYTSGTSGRPKGVLLTEANIWATARNFSGLAAVAAQSVVLCDSPMFHVIGVITNIRPALMHGGALMISDGFVPARTLSRLSDPRLGITHYFAVPQMLAMLRAAPDFDANRLRGLTGLFSGGAPHAADAIRAWAADGIPVSDGFGMSEAGTVSCMPLDLPDIVRRAGAAGIIPPEISVRILDEADRDCLPGQAGEIVVKGENVTAGYWRRPEETAKAFTADGWLRSGDVGHLDEDGYLWVIDRKKDMFISGGENVFPAEIEAVLANHPAIAECAVIGVPDERWGESGHLFIVLRDLVEIDEAALIAFMRTRLAGFKIPRRMSVVASLPRNGTGKLLKAKLRDGLRPVVPG
jgi:fatty-acyl-CoA synthase